MVTDLVAWTGEPVRVAARANRRRSAKQTLQPSSAVSKRTVDTISEAVGEQVRRLARRIRLYPVLPERKTGREYADTDGMSNEWPTPSVAPSVALRLRSRGRMKDPPLQYEKGAGSLQGQCQSPLRIGRSASQNRTAAGEPTSSCASLPQLLSYPFHGLSLNHPPWLASRHWRLDALCTASARRPVGRHIVRPEMRSSGLRNLNHRDEG